MKYFWGIILLVTGLLGFQLSATAAVVIGGTRVIYPENEKEVTVQLKNPSKSPSLIQSWIASSIDNDLTPVPFVVTPALSRIDPNKGQSLRIMYTGEALPKDRESLFYLMILDVPPKPKQGESAPQNFLQLALQSKFKFFFRPNGLVGSVQDAPALVQWRWVKNNQNHYVLEANNPTPYYITYKAIYVEVGGKKIESSNPEMISPKSSLKFNFDGVNHQQALKVNYTIINDYGASVTGQSKVN